MVTPGVDNSPWKLGHIHMPDDLTDKTLIDIGTYDGFFSFEAERRGAKRVLATDQFCWQSTGMGDGEGFKIAHEAFHSRVEAMLIPVEDISPTTVGIFDLVLFLGVLYHAQDPLRYLRAAGSICWETLSSKTHIDASDYERPAMVFDEGSCPNKDPSNLGTNHILRCGDTRGGGFQQAHLFPSVPTQPGRSSCLRLTLNAAERAEPKC